MAKTINSKFKMNDGREIPVIGFGTWKADGDTAAMSACEAIKAGYRLLDCASLYRNEAGVGEGIARGIKEAGIKREDLFITSKVWNRMRGYEKTKAAFEKSLTALGLDYMDLYLIHWPAVKKQFENWEEINLDTWRAMTELCKEGKILSIERHPDADKLVVCQVDVGAEAPIQIVTGAPNVKEGQKVPVVLDGGRVAGGHDGTKTEGGIKIKKGKLRGVESYGMMCSIEELGSTKEMYPDAPEYGIYIFNDDVEVGADAIEVLGLHDAVFEYEITSNRVDCYGVLGIARECAATFRKEFKPPVVEVKGNDEKAEGFISVDIQDKELCPRYCARIVKNVKIAPSPEWMQRRLAACGIRPINNLVDITNYVMEEYGQPMHAYDMSTIAGKKIVVKRASNGDIFQTLDGQERKLDENMLMIWDAEKPIGIAGIMGGENSKITDDVKDMVFEAACFDGTNIRLTAKRLGLRTDASGKFEKGLDPNNAKDAIDRACQLIEEMGAGEVVGGMIDVYDEVRQPKRVPFNPDKINKLLGTDIDKEDMLGYLKISRS